MTETTTPTDEVVQNPSGVEEQEISTLPDEDTDESAVEQVDDTVAEEQDTDSTDDSNEAESKVDKGLAKFAKSQGFDPDNLTPGEVKALKLAQDNQRAFRNQNAGKKLEAEIEKNPDQGETNALLEIEKLKTVNKYNSYWSEHPDDKQYESQMVALLEEEEKNYGYDAKVRLLNNIPRLVREAKYAAGAFDTTSAEEQGRREERERLKKLQEGSADTPHSTTRETSTKTKVDANWVENEYDPSNPEHRALLDKYLSSKGNVY